ncbi:cholesterol 7-desaturase nvd isoform 2-T2 [Spinachia spinachia]
MSNRKAAVVIGLGIAVMLLVQSGDPLDSVRNGSPVWSDLGPLLRAVVCVIAGCSLLALGWLHGLLFGPLEVLRGPDDVGYIVEDGRSRAQAANAVRRRRKIGELPPVFPNGEQVAVFRGQDGTAFVVDAYCPHLGANLAVGGQVVGGCIECPFHGWQFRGNDGKCMRIPYAEKVPEFAKVRCWPSCEVNGQILVWFHCDGEDPQWTIPEQQEITKGEWVYRGRTEHFINAHIEEIPENAADIAHLTHLHTPAIASGVDLRYTNSKAWEFLRHDWKVEWEPESEPNKHCSQMSVKHALTVFGCHCPLLDVRVVARQVGPGVVFLLFNHSFLGRGVILQCVTPVEPLLQCVSHTIFYQSNIPPLVPKFILRAECIQFERDVMIWNNKKYISKPLLVKEDSAIQKHRRWFSQFYSENSPQLQYQRHTLDF